MTKSPLRRLESPPTHDYKTGVMLKLAALALSLAVFIPTIWLISRPSPLKDLSGGALPLTFSTRSRELQRELLSIHAEKGLPNQAAERVSRDSGRLCKPFEELLSSTLFESMKISCDECAGKWNEHFAGNASSSESEHIPFEEFIAFLQSKPGLLDAIVANPEFFDSLDAALDAVNASSKPVSFASFVPEGLPSPMPDLHRICAMRFDRLFADGRTEEAVGALRTLFAIANANLNSDTPDTYYLVDSIDTVSSSLGTKGWTKKGVERLFQLISKQKGRPFPQARLLSYERGKALQSFERIRRIGIRSFDGEPPAFNMLADAARELNPSGVSRALTLCWQDFLYSEDKDEAFLLKNFRLAMMKTPLENILPSPKPKSGLYMSERIHSLMETQSYNDCEIIAKLTSMDISLRIAIGLPYGKSLKNPLTGDPYEVTEGLSVHYGPPMAKFQFIPIPSLTTD